MAYLGRNQIESLGFSHVGENVYISDKASFYNCPKISIGDNCRIDDFCVLSAGSGGIEIGSYIHIAIFSSLIGAGKIYLGDFCNISSRVSIYSSNDDYSGNSMTNPMVDEKYKNVFCADVIIGRHVIIGSGSVILPGVSLGDGVAIGALSMVSQNCDPFYIYAGVPAKKIKERSKNILKLEKEFLKQRE